MTATATAVPGPPKRAISGLMLRYLVLVGLIIVVSVGFSLANENFYSLVNIGILLRSISAPFLVSMVHQEYSLINELTVAGNIYLGNELRRGKTPFLDKRDIARPVKAQLDRFGLDFDPNRPVGDLNSGDKQIVEILRALLSDAWLIVMDAPTSALSQDDKERLFGFTHRMKAAGVPIICISHHMPEIFGIAEEVTVMRDGRIVLSERIDQTTEQAVIKSMTGTKLDDFAKSEMHLTDEVILSVDGLSKPEFYGDVSFTLRRGEILVPTGLRGYGAPELATAIFSLDGVYAGRISYRGTPLIAGRGPATAVREGMGMVTENRDKNGILVPLLVRDNIALPFMEKSLNAGLINAKRVEKVVEKAIADTSTKTSSPSQEIRFRFGGNKQKICFSRWLDPDLELLILLEPTRGIDVHSKADICRIIEDLAERGVGILILSSEIDEVIMLADRVITLSQSQSVGETHTSISKQTGCLPTWRVLAKPPDTRKGRT